MPDYLQGLYESLAQGVQVAQHLQSAAQQQQQLAEQKRSNMANEEVAGRHAAVAEAAERDRQAHDSLVDALSLRTAGAQPVTNTPTGQQLYTPPEGTGALVPGAIGARLPNQVGPQAQTLNFRGQTYRIPSQAEESNTTAARELQQKVAAAKATRDVTAIPLPDQVNSRLYPNATGPTMVQANELGGFNNLYQDLTNRAETAAAKANPPDKPKKVSHVVTSYGNGKTFITPVFETGELGETAVRQGGPAGEAVQEAKPEPKAKAATPGQFSAVEKDKATALSKSAQELQKDLATIQKETSQGQPERVERMRQAYADHAERQKQAQLSYEARWSELTGQDVGHNPWADQAAGGTGSSQPDAGLSPSPASAGGGRGGTAPTAAAAAAGPPAASTPNAAGKTGGATAAPKTTTVDQVKAYAAKFKLDYPTALKRVMAEGYSIKPAK